MVSWSPVRMVAGNLGASSSPTGYSEQTVRNALNMVPDFTDSWMACNTRTPGTLTAIEATGWRGFAPVCRGLYDTARPGRVDHLPG